MTREQRDKTHGPFVEHARIAQLTRYAWFQQPGWNKLNPVQRESLERIAHEAAAILAGDPAWREHWLNIAEFAHLAAEHGPAMQAHDPAPQVEAAIRQAIQADRPKPTDPARPAEAVRKSA